MPKVILDTNFILSAIREKIDIFEEIPEMGFKIVLPSQVIKELKKIEISKKKLRFRDEAKIALKILEKIKFEEIDLKQDYVDLGIIKLAEKNPQIVIASLDRELKNKIPNRFMILRAKKKLEVI